MGGAVRTMRDNKKKKFTLAATYIFLTVIAVAMLIPIYYLLVTTFKTPEHAAVAPMALPSSLDFSGYIKAFEEMEYPRAFRNTFLITLISVTGIVLFSSMAGYVLNRKSDKKAGQLVFLLLLSGMMFPYQMSILGLYKLIRGLNLMNSLWSVILVDITINLPFAVFLMRSYMATVPMELDEAAKIDGAGVFRTFTTIIFPLMKPTIATVAILNTLNVWNDFMGPLYFLQSRKKDVILQEIYRNIGQFSTDWTGIFPMMVLGIMPLMIFYLFMQKYIISGVMAGSVKG